MKKENKLNLLLRLLDDEGESKEVIEKPISEDTEKHLSEKLDSLKVIGKRIHDILLISSKDILNIKEASIYCSLSVNDLYQKTSRRIIPHSKPGKHVFFRKKDLDSFLLSNPK